MAPCLALPSSSCQPYPERPQPLSLTAQPEPRPSFLKINFKFKKVVTCFESIRPNKTAAGTRCRGATGPGTGTASACPAHSLRAQPACSPDGHCGNSSRGGGAQLGAAEAPRLALPCPATARPARPARTGRVLRGPLPACAGGSPTRASERPPASPLGPAPASQIGSPRPK